MKSHCTAGVDVTISNFVGDKTNKVKFEYVLVTLVIPEYGYLIPLMKIWKNVVDSLIVAPTQLLTQVVLVYKHVKILNLKRSFVYFLSLKRIIVGGVVG